MDEPNASKDTAPRKKLVLTVNNRAALSGQRSNFVPQTKTVLVHRQATVVLDSPERAARDKLLNGRSSNLSSLSSIGKQHFKHQSLLAGGGSANTAPKTVQTSRPVASASSAFLDTNTPISSAPPSAQGIPAKQSLLSKLVKSISHADKRNAPQTQPVASIPVGPTSLSSKYKARVERSNEEESARAARASVPAKASDYATCASDYTEPIPAVSNVTSTVNNAQDAPSIAAPSGGLSNLFQGMGKTLTVKSGNTAAPTKAHKLATSFVSNSSSHMVNDADLQVYGEYSCEAAGVVGGYLDSLIQTLAPPVIAAKLSATAQSTSTAAKTSSHTTTEPTDNSTSTNADDVGGEDLSSATVSKNKKKTIAGGADATEEKDNFNNFVRKNLKSGGTSKHLNRATTRVSMSKQRWLTRAGENGQSSGNKGKYNSKFGKGKYGSKGGGSGTYASKSDDAGGGGGGGGGGDNGYNKPRGLQQWGLDALEMSLDLIEQQGTVAAVMVPPAQSAEPPAQDDGQGGQGEDQDQDQNQEQSGSEDGDEEQELDIVSQSDDDELVVEGSVPETSYFTKSAVQSKPVAPRVVAPAAPKVSTASASPRADPAATSYSGANVKTAPASRTISLEAIDKTLRPSSSKRLTAQDKLSAKVTARTKLNDRINAMTACAPKCPGHSMPSKLLVVKKSGANKGKYFYSCTFPAEQRCNFFMWADDNPELLGKASSLYPALLHQHNSDPAAPPDPEQARLQYTLHVYATKLRTMNRDELKQEAFSFNKRSALSSGGGVEKIGITGTKDDIIARLLTEAVRQLGGEVPSSSNGVNGGTSRNSSGRRSKDEHSGSDSEGSAPDTTRKIKAPAKRTKATKTAAVPKTSKALAPVAAKPSRSRKEKQLVLSESDGEEDLMQEVESAEEEEAAVPSQRASRSSARLQAIPAAENETFKASDPASSVPRSSRSRQGTAPAADEEVLLEGSASGSERSENGESEMEIEAEDAEDDSGVQDNASDDGSAEEGEANSDTDSVDIDAAAEVGAADVNADNSDGELSIDFGSDDVSEGENSDQSNEIEVSEAEGEGDSEGSGGSSDDQSDGDQSEEEAEAVVKRSRRGSAPAPSKAAAATKNKPAPVRRARKASAVSVDQDENDDSMDVQEQVDEDALSTVDHLELLLRRNFGFSVFRPGQRWAISRCLAGQNSLLVMPTGAGKSLCYMLPSLALPGLTVVVSPLIALMQDQLRKLPLALPGACLSGSLTAQQMMQISDAVLKGHIKVLYVSPERLCTPSFRRLITLLKQQRAFSHAYGGAGAGEEQPVVSLLCVDEAHCLSQWSYNFRPAFLRIRREVQFIQPAAVLALTATATPRIQYDVMRHLGIPTEAGLMALPVRRDNLQVTVHMITDEEHRRKLIVDLVKNPRIVDVSALAAQEKSAFSAEGADSGAAESTAAVGQKRPRPGVPGGLSALDSKRRESFLTIVYVWRRFEADSLGEYLKASGVQGVAIYHAGIDAGTRARTQLMFDRGKVRCIVATVAFGMGVDKADVRQVIHCTMPKSIESYMQEMGRAGRDGLPAACHLLLQQEDAVLQHSLSHSMQLSRIQLASLLLKVFQLRAAAPLDNKSDVRQYMSQGLLEPEVSLLLDPLEPTIDINSTVVETIMAVLELPPFNLLIVDGTHFDIIKGRFRMNTAAIEKSDILVAALLATNTCKTNTSDTSEFDLPAKSASAGGNGMNDSYGLGLDCSASAAHQGLSESDLKGDTSGAAGSSGWQRDRKLGGSYGGKIQDFECSRLKVALRTGLSVDEVSTGLYKLQKSGVLEYKLQDSALYLKIHNGLSTTASVHTFEGYCATHRASPQMQGGAMGPPGSTANQLYFAWLWQLAGAVYDSLLKIASGGSHRIVDMWRTGKTIAHYTDTASASSKSAKSLAGARNGASSARAVDTTTTSRTANEVVALHGAAQSLLSYVMSDADGEAGADTTESEGLDALSSEMRNLYLATPVPFQTLLQDSADGAEGGDSRAVSKLQDRLRNDVQLLQRDPNLLTAVNVMLKQCVPLLSHQASVDSMRRASQSGTSAANGESTKDSIVVSVQSAKSELLALCMCRILHALPTRLLPASAWRDRSDAWGRYKDVSFEQMLTFIIQELDVRR